MTEKKLLTDDEYTATGGNQCPKCHECDIEADGAMQHDSNVAWRDVKCNDCDFRWQDNYILTGWTAD